MESKESMDRGMAAGREVHRMIRRKRGKSQRLTEEREERKAVSGNRAKKWGSDKA